MNIYFPPKEKNKFKTFSIRIPGMENYLLNKKQKIKANKDCTHYQQTFPINQSVSQLVSNLYPFTTLFLSTNFFFLFFPPFHSIFFFKLMSSDTCHSRWIKPRSRKVKRGRVGSQEATEEGDGCVNVTEQVSREPWNRRSDRFIGGICIA